MVVLPVGALMVSPVGGSHCRPAVRTACHPVSKAYIPPACDQSPGLPPRCPQVPKHTLPNCTICRGCNTELSYMAASTKFFDRIFTNEKGATSGWLFRATTNVTASGEAVVKV